jgi:glutamate/tyrosine decarboxylase-like PLP-dependent enzyme
MLFMRKDQRSVSMQTHFKSNLMASIRKQDLTHALQQSADYARDYLASAADRSVYPTDSAIEALQIFDTALNDLPESPEAILNLLHHYGSPATVLHTGGRYFGFVNGATIPASLPAKWLADIWDQNAALYVMSPIAATLETVVQRWLIDLLRLPESCVAGYVSGSATATLVGLCAGRNHLLMRKGYDPAKSGIRDLPPIKVVLGDGAHATVYKALSILGLGAENVLQVPVDSQGRMISEKMPELDDLSLVIAQAGHVCSGAFDPFVDICCRAAKANAWVHIDGAFGLWARTDQRFDHMTSGIELADSWSVDAHKTLNAPYDNGIIFCKHPETLVQSMHLAGSYIRASTERDGMFFTPEMSRRARAVDLWSTLKGLGRQGVAELVYELHAKAVYFAKSLAQHGLEILNDVCFNQVILRDGSDAQTEALMVAIQRSGVLWLGGAKWEGKSVMRISVSSYRTTYSDIDLCVEKIAELRLKHF